jgi:hypothetical protein
MVKKPRRATVGESALAIALEPHEGPATEAAREVAMPQRGAHTLDARESRRTRMCCEAQLTPTHESACQMLLVQIAHGAAEQADRARTTPGRFTPSDPSDGHVAVS